MTKPQPTAASCEAAANYMLSVLGYDRDAHTRSCAEYVRTPENDLASYPLPGLLTRHADEREAQVIAGVVAWLREKEGAWRSVVRDAAGVGAPHIPRYLAAGVERGDWKGPRND